MGSCKDRCCHAKIASLSCASCRSTYWSGQELSFGMPKKLRADIHRMLTPSPPKKKVPKIYTLDFPLLRLIGFSENFLRIFGKFPLPWENIFDPLVKLSRASWSVCTLHQLPEVSNINFQQVFFRILYLLTPKFIQGQILHSKISRENFHGKLPSFSIYALGRSTTSCERSPLHPSRCYPLLMLMVVGTLRAWCFFCFSEVFWGEDSIHWELKTFSKLWLFGISKRVWNLWLFGFFWYTFLYLVVWCCLYKNLRLTDWQTLKKCSKQSQQPESVIVNSSFIVHRLLSTRKWIEFLTWNFFQKLGVDFFINSDKSRKLKGTSRSWAWGAKVDGQGSSVRSASAPVHAEEEQIWVFFLKGYLAPFFPKGDVNNALRIL